jgi:hypothetical protein
MLTTGFKFFFGFAVAAITAAILFGYTTGGSNIGPLTIGYKGAVGAQLPYAVLLIAGVASAALAGVLVAFRDGDARAAAQVLGVDTPPVQRPTTASPWPLVAAFGVGITAVGLVVHAALVALGLGVIVLAALEWTMDAWADRATGDPQANKALRDQITRPFELPVGGALIVAVVVLGLSRVFLALPKEGAVWLAMGVAGVVFLVAVALVLAPRPSKNVVAGVLLVGGLAVIGGGIAAAAIGPREFEKHSTEHSTEKTGTAGTTPSTGASGATTTTARK